MLTIVPRGSSAAGGGMHRREFLRVGTLGLSVGTLGLGGLTLADLLRGRAAAAPGRETPNRRSSFT